MTTTAGRPDRLRRPAQRARPTRARRGRWTSAAPACVDPMVHRFGLIYDISAFSETLGNIRRGGGKEEMQLLPADAALPAQARRDRRAAPPAVREVPRRRRVLHHPPRPAPRARRHRDPALLLRDEAQRLRLQQRPAHRPQLRLLPPAADEDLARLQRAHHRVLRPRHRRALAPDHRQGQQGDRGDRRVPRSPTATTQANVQQFFAPLARGVDVIDHTAARPRVLRLHQRQRSPRQRRDRRLDAAAAGAVERARATKAQRCSASRRAGATTSASPPPSPASELVGTPPHRQGVR